MSKKTRLHSITIAAAALVSLVAAESVTGQPAVPRAAKIASYLQTNHDFGYFNGAALVAEGDRVLFKGGFGLADMSWEIPNSASTKFQIGSVTKQFTAALILQLVEAGKLELDDPVTKILPDYPAAQGDRITIDHLLTHTAGIPSYTGFPDFMTFTRNQYAVDSLVAMFSGLPLEFDPGTSWSYSNSGYYLLGAIIEEIEGRPYDEVLRDRILEPLGLDDSGYDDRTAVIKQMASGYLKLGSEYQRAPYTDASVPYAAGMMYSTVEDLYKWDQALYDRGPFERRETNELFLEPQIAMVEDDESAGQYGFGWIFGDQAVGADTAHIVMHGGGIFGFSTGFWRIPDERRTVILMDNTGSSSLGQIGEGLIQILYGQEPEMPKQGIASVLRPVIEAEGVDAAVARYQELRETDPEAYNFGEGQLNELGYQYLSADRPDIAIRIFQLNVDQYPESANTYDSLGEAYLEAGDRDQAIANYRKALELNPGFPSARRMLEQLGIEVDEPDVELSIDELEEYVGTYAVAPTFSLDITREGEQMYVQGTGQPRVEIFPRAKDRFYLTAVDAQITFHRGESGEVESLTLHQAGQNLPAPKSK